MIWNWACHPVCYYDNTAVSADYPGYVRDKLRHKKKSSELPVLFLQGFAGDLRPPAFTKQLMHPPFFNKYLAKNRLIFSAWSKIQWENWASKIFDSLERGMSHLSELKPKLSSKKISVAIEQLIEIDRSSLTNDRYFSVQRINLSEKVFIIAISAEMSVGYVNLLRKQFDADSVIIPVGYSDDVFGYFPTNNQRLEGGYEAVGFFDAFSIKKWRTDDLEMKFKSLLRQLVK